MFFWLLAAISVVSCLVLLYVDGRRRERAVWHDWELLLTNKGERTYEAVEKRVHSEAALVDVALARAVEVNRLGSTEEAIRLLETGCGVIAWFAPNMRRALAGMAVFSRMVAAMAPLPPLRPGDFQMTQLVSLAYLNALLHQFLVSTAERFRLRVHILRAGFGMASHLLFRSRDRISGEPAEIQAWTAVAAIRHDFTTLTDESLESFRVLLTSLAAEPKNASPFARGGAARL
jgi:hypothetical protein